jgi:hypothetical protein
VGLDAVVYRNRKHLKLGPDGNAAQLVPETGEVYFENDEISRKYRGERHAAERRLGNIAEIAELREQISRLRGPESVVLQKVLHLGTHSGDSIPLDAIPALSAELNFIRSNREHSPEMLRFVTSLEELIRAAKDEGNPIVFV